MTASDELMVEFQRGVTEDKARAVVAGIGGLVRRRMRTDHEDLVMLLIRVDAGTAEQASQALGRSSAVTRTERNAQDYRLI